MGRNGWQVAWCVVVLGCGRVPSTAGTSFFCRSADDCTGLLCVDSLCAQPAPPTPAPPEGFDACAAPAACVDDAWAQWPVPADQARGGALKVQTATDSVVDAVTGLVWRRTVSAPFLPHEAATWCDMPLGDGAQWRLPTLVELTTLVDFDGAMPAIDAVAFPDTPAGPFITSTAYAPAPQRRWVIDFGAGTSFADTGEPVVVRCVR